MHKRRFLLWVAFGLSWLPTMALSVIAVNNLPGHQDVHFQAQWMQDSLTGMYVLMLFYLRAWGYAFLAFAKFPRDGITFFLYILWEMVVLFTTWWGLNILLSSFEWIPEGTTVLLALVVIAPTIYLWQQLFPLQKTRQSHT